MWAFSNGSVKDTLSSDISWVFLFLSQNHQMKTKLSFSLEEDSQRSFMRLGNVYLPWSFFYSLKLGNNCSLVTCYGIEYHLLSWKKAMNSFFFKLRCISIVWQKWGKSMHCRQIHFVFVFSCRDDIPLTVVLTFCSEGDNISDAVNLFLYLNAWLKMVPKEKVRD